MSSVRSRTLLRELRLACGLTQEELALRARFSTTSLVSGIERGRYRCGPVTMERLALALGVAPEDLAGLVAPRGKRGWRR